MLNRVIGVVGILALLAAVAMVMPQRSTASDTATLHAVNGFRQPDPLRSTRAVFQPVQMTVPIGFADGSTLANAVAMVVPARRRFVLEDLSVRADVPKGQTVLEAGLQLDAPGTRYVFLPMRFAGSGASNIVPQPDTDEFNGGRLARAYAEPGKTVGAYAYRNSTTGTGIAFVSISGYLANL